jgi:hypothetical protein
MRKKRTKMKNKNRQLMKIKPKLKMIKHRITINSLIVTKMMSTKKLKVFKKNLIKKRKMIMKILIRTTRETAAVMI